MRTYWATVDLETVDTFTKGGVPYGAELYVVYTARYEGQDCGGKDLAGYVDFGAGVGGREEETGGWGRGCREVVVDTRCY